jgi:hypothetical protein
VLSACTPFNPFAGIGTRQRADTEAEKWQGAGISDYALTVTLTCFCPGLKYSTMVLDGSAVDFTPARGSDMSAWTRSYEPRTVEELYRLIDRFSKTADSVDVTYNELGVPVRIAIDREQNAIDDELAYRVRFARIEF